MRTAIYPEGGSQTQILLYVRINLKIKLYLFAKDNEALHIIKIKPFKVLSIKSSKLENIFNIPIVQ